MNEEQIIQALADHLGDFTPAPGWNPCRNWNDLGQVLAHAGTLRISRRGAGVYTARINDGQEAKADTQQYAAALACAMYFAEGRRMPRPMLENVARYIQENPGCFIPDISKHAGHTPETSRRMVRTLMAAGRAARQGRRIYPADALPPVDQVVEKARANPGAFGLMVAQLT